MIVSLMKSSPPTGIAATGWLHDESRLIKEHTPKRETEMNREWVIVNER